MKVEYTYRAAHEFTEDSNRKEWMIDSIRHKLSNLIAKKIPVTEKDISKYYDDEGKFNPVKHTSEFHAEIHVLTQDQIDQIKQFVSKLSGYEYQSRLEQFNEILNQNPLKL